MVTVRRPEAGISRASPTGYKPGVVSETATLRQWLEVKAKDQAKHDS